MLYLQSVLIISCFICKASLLCHALYAKRPCYFMLHMQSVLAISCFICRVAGKCNLGTSPGVVLARLPLAIRPSPPALGSWPQTLLKKHNCLNKRFFCSQANVMMPGYFEVINPHTVGSLTIPRASIKWVRLWELMAYILNMHSYSSAYINRVGLACLLLVV